MYIRGMPQPIPTGHPSLSLSLSVSLTLCFSFSVSLSLSQYISFYVSITLSLTRSLFFSVSLTLSLQLDPTLFSSSLFLALSRQRVACHLVSSHDRLGASHLNGIMPLEADYVISSIPVSVNQVFVIFVMYNFVSYTYQFHSLAPFCYIVSLSPFPLSPFCLLP